MVDDCCGMLEALALPIKRLETDIHQLAQTDPGPRRCVSCREWDCSLL